MHQLWITPHGALKAAQRNRATSRRNADGATAVSFSQPGRFSATLLVGADGLVTQVDSVVADPVLGDTKAVTTYSDYRDFGGVKFPMRVRQTMGGYPVLDLAVTAVEVNPAASLDVPEAARNQAERVVVERLGAGVWFVAGGSHHSVAIEMADHLVLVEAPLSDARMLAVIEQVKTLAPGKPIRYVVNSHGHFDHSGGVRAAVAEGATVVTGAANVPYFERAFATPNALRPDRMAQAGKAAKFVAVGDKLAMADAMRAIEFHAITGSPHAESFLMVYLPQERILIEADAFTPAAPNAPPPATPNPNHLSLIANIERLGLPGRSHRAAARAGRSGGGSVRGGGQDAASIARGGETSARAAPGSAARSSARRRGGGAEELARARSGAAEHQDRLRQRRQQLGEAGDLVGAVDVRRHRQPCVLEPGGARRGLDARRRRLVRAAFEVGPVVDDAAKAGRGGFGHRLGAELRRDRDVVRQGLEGQGHRGLLRQ